MDLKQGTPPVQKRGPRRPPSTSASMNQRSQHLSFLIEEGHIELPPIEVSPGLFLREVLQQENAVVVPTTANFLLPPLTCWSLMAIDHHRVFMDVQLLHDVYMNPKKMLKLDVRQYPSQELEARYWYLLHKDIDLIVASHTAGQKAKCSERLVVLLKEVKEMVKDALGSSKPDMDEYYDVDILVAEIETGQFRVEGYARLLHTFLGLIRPMAVQTWDMLQQLVDPALHTNITAFLRHILKLLEAIKTDKMCHQLSVLRPAMLENLLMLERQHWDGQNGSNFMQTRSWLLTTKRTNEDALRRLRKNEQTFFIFSKAISDLIVADEELALPECLQLDESNVDSQRESARLLILTALGLGILRQLTGMMRVSQNQIDLFKEALLFLFKRNTFCPTRLALDAEVVVVGLAEEVFRSKLSLGNQARVRNLCREVFTDPTNPLRQAIKSRLRDHLVDLLWKRAGPGLVGYNGVQMELDALSEAFTRMAFLNWNVHKNRYESICRQ